MEKFHRQVLLLFIGIFLAFNIIIKLFCYRKLVWKWAGLVNKTLAFASILISAEQYTQEYFPHMFLSTCYCICLLKQFNTFPEHLLFQSVWGGVMSRQHCTIPDPKIQEEHARERRGIYSPYIDRQPKCLLGVLCPNCPSTPESQPTVFTRMKYATKNFAFNAH